MAGVEVASVFKLVEQACSRLGEGVGAGLVSRCNSLMPGKSDL